MCHTEGLLLLEHCSISTPVFLWHFPLIVSSASCCVGPQYQAVWVIFVKSLRCGMNLLRYCTNPNSRCTAATYSGVGISKTACTLCGSTWSPCAVAMCPMKGTLGSLSRILLALSCKQRSLHHFRKAIRFSSWSAAACSSVLPNPTTMKSLAMTFVHASSAGIPRVLKRSQMAGVSIGIHQMGCWM